MGKGSTVIEPFHTYPWEHFTPKNQKRCLLLRIASLRHYERSSDSCLLNSQQAASLPCGPPTGCILLRTPRRRARKNTGNLLRLRARVALSEPVSLTSSRT